MIPVISSSLRSHIAWLGVILLFVPKINLISFGGESAGLRIDDLIILWMLALITMCSMLTSARMGPASSVEKLVLCIVAVMLVSNLFNIYIYGQSSILYSLRMLEYFVFFFVGYYFATSNKIDRLMWSLLIANGVIIILQAVGLVGGFASEGYSNTVGRSIGLTGGPWEVGVVLNLVFSILLFSQKRATSFVLSLFIFIMLLLLLTGARMPTLAHIFILLFYYHKKSRSKTLLLLKLLAVGLPFVAALILIPNPVLERSENLANVAGNISVLSEALDKVNPRPTVPVEEPDTERFEDSDASWVMRTLKWAVALKMYANTASFWVWGVGPGRLWTAVDGGWIRVLSETGLLGLSLFILLFRSIGKLGLGAKGAIIAMTISMFMIDIYMAYKVMSLLFFMTGYMLCVSRGVLPVESGPDEARIMPFDPAQARVI